MVAVSKRFQHVTQILNKYNYQNGFVFQIIRKYAQKNCNYLFQSEAQTLLWLLNALRREIYYQLFIAMCEEVDRLVRMHLRKNH